MKKITYFIVPVLIGGLFLFGLDKFLDHEIKDLLNKKDLIPVMNYPLSSEKDKGIILNNHLLKQNDIMMIGSSELGLATKQHPTYYFNTHRSKNGVFTIGKAYTQNLQDATIIGSTDPNIKDKKVVLLLSMQWFMDKEGVTPQHYQGRFSPVQFYAFLQNPEISKENKEEFAKRTIELLAGSGEFKPEAVYAKLYISDSFISKVEKAILHPYFKARQFEVVLKDKGMLFRKLLRAPEKKEVKKGEPINWENETKQAIEDAKKRVGNNDLCIDKMYYEKNFGKNLDKMKGRYDYVNLLESREFDDYELTLSVCKDLGIKPVVVMLPAMDKFYNLTGISREERHAFYDKAEKMAKQKGFDVIDLRDKETEKYYLRDVMHLGTKGWVDVCEKLFKKFDQQ